MEREISPPALKGSLDMSQFPGVLALVYFSCLKHHERVDENHLRELKREIQRDGFLIYPVVVDRASLVILDGHHRVRALRELGCELIPTYLVDYGDNSVKVVSWRPEIPVNKEGVVSRGLSGELYPSKTTRHIWPWQIPMCPISLAFLKRACFCADFM
jgi:hypothetical protein